MDKAGMVEIKVSEAKSFAVAQGETTGSAGVTDTYKRNGYFSQITRARKRRRYSVRTLHSYQPDR
jgi:hypothetical protein